MSGGLFGSPEWSQPSRPVDFEADLRRAIEQVKNEPPPPPHQHMVSGALLRENGQMFCACGTLIVGDNGKLREARCDEYPVGHPFYSATPTPSNKEDAS